MINDAASCARGEKREEVVEMKKMTSNKTDHAVKRERGKRGKRGERGKRDEKIEVKR